MKRSSWQALAALSLILFVVFAGMTYHWCAKVTKLRKEGKTEEASVIRHEKRRNIGKGRRIDRHIVVSYFADKPGQGAAKPAPTQKTEGDAVSRILGGLDKSLAKMRNRKYTKAQIPVDKSDFAKHPVGSKVKIVYHPEKPEDAMLASRLAEFDFTIYYAITGICLLAFVVSLACYLKASPAK